MKTSNMRLALLGILFLAGTAWAVAEGVVDRFALNRPAHFLSGIYVGNAASNITGNTDNKVTRVLGESATVDFAAADDGTSESGAITVTGARAGDPCFVGVPTAAGALDADFGCYVSATDTVKVTFSPHSTTRGLTAASGDAGTGSGVATVTVPASSACACSNATSQEVVKCSVSSTTLTATSASEAQVFGYSCAAPVDPASGTYYVRVISSQ